jgi:hypothetical protein
VSPSPKRGLVASGVLAVVLAARVVLDRTGLAPSEYRLATRGTDIAVYAVIVAAAIVCACWPARRRAVLAAGGAIGLTIALHAWVLPLFGYVVLAIVLARLAIPIAARFAIAIVAWLAVPAARIAVLGAQAQADTILLALWWVGLLYACLYLIVERARALPGEATTAVDDACYLVAPARLVIPFFQPISPRDLFERERPSYSWRLIGRGAALAGYGLALGVIAHKAPHVFRGHGQPLHSAVRFVAFYARVAHAIILAIAVFRLLGFALRSGFRWPFVSRSFAELFRRFNFYVRDAVVSLFYMPILGHLRHRLPRRAASIVAAFAGILIGSFVLQDLLIPCGIAIDPLDELGQLLRPHRVLGMLAMWCLIVFPNAGIIPRRRASVGRLRAVFQAAVVAATFVALWYFEGE